MIRWKYVVPRLLGIAAIVSVLCLAMGPLIGFMIVYGGQAVTGARVEIDHVEVDLMGSQVSVVGLKVADPTHEHQNLLEAERIEFDVESQAVLRRKLVIHEGRLSGLKIQTGRKESGTLEGSEGEDGTSVVTKVRERGEEWFDSSVGKLQDDLENDLQTVGLSRELRERWPREYETLRQRGKQIETDGKQLSDDVEQIAERPLDNLHLIQPTLGRVDRLHADMVAAQKELQRLQQQMRSDQEAMMKAKDHDVVYLREKLHVDALDAASLNDYLLGPVWSERLRQALAWIEYSRQFTSEESADAPSAARGISVLFPGYHSIDPDDFTFAEVGLRCLAA